MVCWYAGLAGSNALPVTGVSSRSSSRSRTGPSRVCHVGRWLSTANFAQRFLTSWYLSSYKETYVDTQLLGARYCQ